AVHIDPRAPAPPADPFDAGPEGAGDAVVSPSDYGGGSLLNLVAELEGRLSGKASSPRLHPHLSDLIPHGSSYLLVVCDGLGAPQLDHPAAASLRGSMAASLDGVFPTTTTVSLATLATGLAPNRHGILGYQLYLPDLDAVANTIKWTTLWGDRLPIDTAAMLPGPNLWERLTGAGVEAITVQPVSFVDTPLTRLLYRGCRFEPVRTLEEVVAASVDLAATPGRLVMTYLPQVDFAAHVRGQRSPEYAAALALVDTAWSRIAARVRPGTVVVGTADHGHVDFPPDRQIRIAKPYHEGRVFSGDSRVMFVHGDGAALAGVLPATWLPIEHMDGWWGPGPVDPAFAGRVPDGALIADDGYVILHRFSDQRLIGHHGGLTPAERRIPLLIAGSDDKL
ncbi:MAG: alkaline phosphatase family protein, partial [Actinomycetota bacterium]|nr:alkaline phosphatase family protein [Actinomycetota bacterium]